MTYEKLAAKPNATAKEREEMFQKMDVYERVKCMKAGLYNAYGDYDHLEGMMDAIEENKEEENNTVPPEENDKRLIQV